MARDLIIDEVRQFRDAYAKRFHYDLEAICRDIRARQTQCGRKVVSLPPKPVQAPLVQPGEKKEPLLCETFLAYHDSIRSDHTA
jgi:hypothetical protein